MSFIRSLLCDHEYEFVRNIHGDEINHCGGFRSVWRCRKCGQIAWGRHLYYKDKKKDER